MKKIIKASAGLLTAVIVSLFSVTGYYAVKLPDSFYVQKGKNLELSTKLSIDTKSDTALPSFASGKLLSAESTELRLFGLIPVKDVEIQTIETPMLIPGGEPFGIKLLMEGVMIVGMGEIKTDSGMICPAKDCGLEEGDIIISVNNENIESNAQIQKIVSESHGDFIEVVYTHDGKKNTAMLKPAESVIDKSYKAGIWVRDSMAGIGTVTYYEADTGRFGGLGHAVCDTDTGEMIPISSGEVSDVTITEVLKGASGVPGELHGEFTSILSSGAIYYNNKYGVYGEMFEAQDSSKAIPMGLKQEIEKGEAVIYTTIDKSGPKAYSISIEEIDYNNSGTKNMVIKVTDKELIEKTGGIVQGMSGSPIIQNGKIIGAVTHVFVNDPLMGYGIFCENMYESGTKE